MIDQLTLNQLVQRGLTVNQLVFTDCLLAMAYYIHRYFVPTP